MGKVTIAEVAKVAGVSPSSVSLFLSGKASGRIKKANQERIVAAVQSTGYRPNRSARELATGKAQRIQVFCPDISNPYFGHVIAGIADSLGSTTPLSLEVLQGERHYELAHVLQVLSAEFGATVLVSPSDEVVDGLPADGKFLLVDYPDTGGDWPTFGYSPSAGAEQIVDHLVELGHRNIAYIGLEHSAARTLRERRRVLLSLLRKQGGGIVRELLVDGVSPSKTRDLAAKLIPDWLDAGVTAVVCEDEQFAIGLLAALRSLKVSVPNELSVVAFNGLFASEVYGPSLTCVHLPTTELGKLAGRGALALLDDEASTDLGVTLETPLIIRESTGPAPL